MNFQKDLDNWLQEKEIEIRREAARYVFHESPQVHETMDDAESFLENKLVELAENITRNPLELKRESGVIYIETINNKGEKIGTGYRPVSQMKEFGCFLVPEIIVMSFFINVQFNNRGYAIPSWYFGGMRSSYAFIRDDVCVRLSRSDGLALMLRPYLSEFSKQRVESLVSSLLHLQGKKPRTKKRMQRI